MTVCGGASLGGAPCAALPAQRRQAALRLPAGVLEGPGQAWAGSAKGVCGLGANGQAPGGLGPVGSGRSRARPPLTPSHLHTPITPGGDSTDRVSIPGSAGHAASGMWPWVCVQNPWGLLMGPFPSLGEARSLMSPAASQGARPRCPHFE